MHRPPQVPSMLPSHARALYAAGITLPERLAAAEPAELEVALSRSFQQGRKRKEPEGGSKAGGGGSGKAGSGKGALPGTPCTCPWVCTVLAACSIFYAVSAALLSSLMGTCAAGCTCSSRPFQIEEATETHMCSILLAVP